MSTWLEETENQFAFFLEDDIPSNENIDDNENVKGVGEGKCL
jgi:hypothetical protein